MNELKMIKFKILFKNSWNTVFLRGTYAPKNVFTTMFFNHYDTEIPEETSSTPYLPVGLGRKPLPKKKKKKILFGYTPEGKG